MSMGCTLLLLFLACGMGGASAVAQTDNTEQLQQRMFCKSSRGVHFCPEPVINSFPEIIDLPRTARGSPAQRPDLSSL
jgi:hypothetical protein